MIKLIGLDPSLRNFGVSKAYFDPSTKSLDIYDGFVIQSKPTKSKSQAKQDIETAYSTFNCLSPLIAEVDYFTAEVPTGSRSSRAMASYGICLGILGSLVATNPNFYHCTPYDVKKVVGTKETSKEEIIEWVKQTYPSVLSWLPKTKNKAEHICDSIVTLHLLTHNPDFLKRVSL